MKTEAPSDQAERRRATAITRRGVLSTASALALSLVLPSSAEALVKREFFVSRTTRTEEINDWLALARPWHLSSIRGACKIDRPIVTPSEGVIDFGDTLIELSSGADCNMLQNPALKPVRSSGVDAIVERKAGQLTISSKSAYFTEEDLGRYVAVVNGEFAGASTYGRVREILTTRSVVIDGLCLEAENRGTVRIFNRDRNIRVLGGHWIREDVAGQGTDLHSLLFRRVDGLSLENVDVRVSGAKYAINLGDCTRFRVANIVFATSSDGVHVNGPAREGVISNIRGETGDDSVALTGNDYGTYADVFGNIEDVEVSNVRATSRHANLAKALAGAGCEIDEVLIENVRGSAAQNAVWIGDDNGQPRTRDGRHGNIRVRDVAAATTTLKSPTVGCNLVNGIDLLDVREIRDTSPDTGLQIGVALGKNAEVGEIRISDIRLPHSIESAAGELEPAVYIYGVDGARMNKLNVVHPAGRTRGAAALLTLVHVQVDALTLEAPSLTAEDNSATHWINLLPSSKANRILVRGGSIRGGTSVIRASDRTRLELSEKAIVRGCDYLLDQRAGDATLVVGRSAQASTRRAWVSAAAGVDAVNITSTRAATNAQSRTVELMSAMTQLSVSEL